MERKEGYYWVRTGIDWEVAFWRGDGCWKAVGGNMNYSDFAFDEIDENIIERKKTNNHE